jgi:Helicase conserved C-terminal domain/SNF2-related domain
MNQGGVRRNLKCPFKRQNKFIPQKHQEFIADYFKKTPYKGLVLFHKLGSGKTCTSIISSEMFLSRFPKFNDTIYVLSPGSLRSNFINEYCSVCGTNHLQRFVFITYNTNVEKFLPDSFDNSIVIIDEFHTVINGVLNGTKNYVAIFNLLVKSNCKILLLSGTPIYASVEEIGVIINLLKPGQLKQIDIRKHYENNIESQEILNLLDSQEERLKKLLSGIISYVGDTLDQTQFPDIIQQEPFKIEMSEYQTIGFSEAVEKEQIMLGSALDKLQKSPVGSKEYKDAKSIVALTSKNILSKSVSNICYPSDVQYQEYLFRRKSGQNKDENKDDENEIGSVSLEKNFAAFLDRLKEKDPNKNSQQVDINSIKEKIADKEIQHEGWIEKNGFIGSTYSRKVKKLLDNIVDHIESKHVVFSFFKERGGVDLIGTLLGLCGIKYLSYTGSTGSDSIRKSILDKFNNINNLYGEKYKVLLITDAGAFGINLKAVQHVHLFESEHIENKVRQIIGRASRFKSHIDLPLVQRKVNVWRYWSVYPKTIDGREIPETLAIDEKIYLSAKTYVVQLDKLTQLLIDSSIEKNSPRI